MARVRTQHVKPQVVQRALKDAETLCRTRQARLTPLRRQVLELVLRTGRPVGAYELLEQLQRRGHSGAPPTIYRALDFLQAQGLVHRIATANTYVACNHPGAAHHALIFVCTRCGNAVEMEAAQVSETLGRRAAKLGFRIPEQPIEVAGTCGSCQAAE